MKKIIVAIDGYSACGKSTTAKAVAKTLGYAYIDTGAMYRAVTLHFLRNFVTLTNHNEVEKALNDIHITFQRSEKTNLNETFLNGLNVEQQIRQMYISELVSEVSALPEVRHAMVAQQKAMGKHKGLVMDGRDIGTHVFPHAELKIFMTAEMPIRAHRRQQELLNNGQLVSIEAVIENLTHRDYIDTTRKESPLVQAEDALLLDISHLLVEEQVAFVVERAKAKIAGM
jgi:cytidylate kinase